MRDANAVAARVVVSMRAGDTAALAPSSRVEASTAAVGARPRRARRPRSKSRARERRPLTEPIGQRRAHRRLLVRIAFEVAEHDHRPVIRREPVHLLDDRRPQVAIGAVGGGGLGDEFEGRPFLRIPTRRVLPRSQRHAARHSVHPGTEPTTIADRSGPAHQDQECRLERILGVVRVGAGRGGRRSGPSARVAGPVPRTRPRRDGGRTAPGADPQSVRKRSPRRTAGEPAAQPRRCLRQVSRSASPSGPHIVRPLR